MSHYLFHLGFLQLGCLLDPFCATSTDVKCTREVAPTLAHELTRVLEKNSGLILVIYIYKKYYFEF